jgi:hypothetical protein
MTEVGYSIGAVFYDDNDVYKLSRYDGGYTGFD